MDILRSKEKEKKELIKKEMLAHLDNLTKPKGSLGKLEEISLKLSLIKEEVPPKISKKAHFIFVGDHGVVEEGVSLYPQEVTSQMVYNFLNGGAAINVFARYYSYDLFCIDCGVKKDFEENIKKRNDFFDMKVNNGTKNILKEPAMNEEEYEKAYKYGEKLANFVIEKGYDLISLGDMGIGNTTIASTILIALGFNPDDIVDKGTGIDEEMLKHKKEVIVKAVEKHKPYKDTKDILIKVGGYEFVVIKSFVENLIDKKIAIISDGFPITSALYPVFVDIPDSIDFLFAGHLSKVKGHKNVLNKMGLEPIINLEMRLGEGTGAIIGGSIVELSSKMACEMATFSGANVSKSIKEEKRY
ncbi:MAG: nicotinate-nucleotide--dimethylbenzimidazole phosphoribosyltransferase [Spirochaetes bacterium]|nr:nicotinate-nucleotide--dimethylbenzimidazole phosphoribosyltransferase [Spirochaetota bacterium]